MEEELFSLFQELDDNEKRNQISTELEHISKLLDIVHEKYKIEKLPSSMYAYNKALDKDMDNDQYFNLMYENLVYIRKDILTLINRMLKDK